MKPRSVGSDWWQSRNGFQHLNTSEVKAAQSRPTLCDPCPVHGILQARILQWVAFPFSSGSSLPRNETGVSCIAGGIFTNWAMREAPHKGDPLKTDPFLPFPPPVPPTKSDDALPLSGQVQGVITVQMPSCGFGDQQGFWAEDSLSCRLASPSTHLPVSVLIWPCLPIWAHWPFLWGSTRDSFGQTRLPPTPHHEFCSCVLSHSSYSWLQLYVDFCDSASGFSLPPDSKSHETGGFVLYILCSARGTWPAT